MNNDEKPTPSAAEKERGSGKPARWKLGVPEPSRHSGQAVDRQEWTHEKLQGLLGISHEDRYVADHAFENTLDEINAALAVERTKVENLHKILGEKREIIKSLKVQQKLMNATGQGTWDNGI